MKYSVAVVAAVAGLTSAQDIGIIPACAQPCIISAVQSSTNCAVTDYPCICTNENALIAAASPCVIQSCGADVATGQVLPATQQFCSEVAAAGSGSSSAPASSSSAAAPPSSSAAATTSAAQSSAHSAESSAASSAASYPVSSHAATTSSAAAATTVATSTHAASGNATRTAASTTSAVTAGAAVVGSIGSFAMLLLGAVAAL